MKRKTISVLLALVLVLSFSLVMAVPAGAQEEMPDAIVLPFELGAQNDIDATAEWSSVDKHAGSSSVHLVTGPKELDPAWGDGDEARILIDLSAAPEEEVLRLGDIDTISWWVSTKLGYSPHLDITMDVDGDEIVDPEDMLTAELACNNTNYSYPPVPGAEEWRQTFEMTTGDGFDQIDGTTTFWVTKMGAGTYDAPFGTLDEWRTTGGQQGTGPDTGDVIPIYTDDTPILKLEIEVDNWIVESEAYVDDITIKVVEMPTPLLLCGQIQDAIDTVGSDAFIAVNAGTYTEDLVIPASKSNLMLYGSPGATIKGVAMTDSTLWPLAAPNIEVLADGTIIGDFTIQGPDPVAGYYSSGMIIGASGVGIYRNAFEVTNSNDESGADVSQGLQTYNKRAIPGVDVSGLVIYDNTFTSHGAGTIGFEAIYINRDEGSGDVIIVNNDFSGYVVRGITTERSNTKISDNSLTTQASTLVLSGILVMDIGGYYDVGAEAQDNIGITGNTIEGFTEGIKAGPSDASQVLTDINISRNTIQLNDIGIKVRSSAGAVNVNFNNIAGNTTCGVENADTENTLNAGQNYWGDISGPTVEGEDQYYSGAGDKVSGDVHFEPWLTRDFQTVQTDNIAYFGQPMVSLNTGWNTFSTPIALDGGCDTWGEYVALGDGLNIHGTSPAYAFNGAIQDWVPLIGENADYPIKPCDAIYVRMAEPDTAAILYSPEPSAPTKDVYQGWNLVGLASLDSMPVNDALTSLYMVTSDLTGYSVVISPPLAQNPWTLVRDGGAPPMEPTRGYWVFMENGPDTLAGFTFTPFSLEGGPGGEGGLMEVPFEWYSVTEGSADYATDTDSSFTHTLPWSFPFAGKEIVEIEVSAEGYIELLESGESAENCCSYGTLWEFKQDYPTADFIIAWCDDLQTGDGYYAVEYNGDVVVVQWITSVCCDEVYNLNYVQLWLFPDGSIQWNFKEFNWETLCCGVVSGIYESDSGILLDVANAMGEPSGMCITPEKSYRYFGQYWP